MEMNSAIEAFGALAQPTRLAVFRMLVKAGAKGVCSGELGESLNVRANTMSTNLAVLQRAGLVRSEREGRSIRYFADMAGIGKLLGYLMEDCCGGKPELCRPAIAEISCGC
jgi:DNA-binding transcriptional ArsR family regulator